MDGDGHVCGGPFYYIEYGMGKKWKWLAKVFAFFGACVGLFWYRYFLSGEWYLIGSSGFLILKKGTYSEYFWR